MPSPFYRGCWHEVRQGFIIGYHHYSPQQMVLRLHVSFITHKVSLGQACAHCPKFHSADLRKDPGFIPVPAWLHVLTNQLSVIGLVGPYPTNYLDTVPAYPKAAWPFFYKGLLLVFLYFRISSEILLTYTPLKLYLLTPVQHAWVKHTLSIHSEPG